MLSSKRQKRTMIGMTVCMIPVAVSIVLTLTHEKACFAASAPSVAASAPSVEEITVETEEEPKRADFDDMSAMPCENPEAFRKWLATYEEETDEQETSKKAPAETTGESRMDGDAADQVDAADPEGDRSDSSPEEMASETSDPILYTIGGELIDPEIQRKLYRALEAEGIGYWYTGALCQMWQESQGQQYRINETNLEDMGLFQYKNRYWDWSEGDIFDADVQIRKYAREMAARFNAGLTADEAISRHNTSDFVTEVNWQYVQEVKRHLPTMEVIE